MITEADMEFARWLGGRRRSKVAREKSPLPIDEVRRRRYDAETERLRCEVRVRAAVDRERAAR